MNHQQQIKNPAQKIKKSMEGSIKKIVNSISDRNVEICNLMKNPPKGATSEYVDRALGRHLGLCDALDIIQKHQQSDSADKKHPLKIAFDNYKESNLDSFDVGSLGRDPQYLNNRIERAFQEGWNAYERAVKETTTIK